MKSWQEMSVIAKDLKRQTPCDVPSPHRKRKDTKRWCGGHEGRKHIYAWVLSSYFTNNTYERRCATCDKKNGGWCREPPRWRNKPCICRHHTK